MGFQSHLLEFSASSHFVFERRDAVRSVTYRAKRNHAGDLCIQLFRGGLGFTNTALVDGSRSRAGGRP
jgi:hypothetical protein